MLDALLADAGHAGLRDEALLLTSELVTNGVIHARTEVELDIVADPGGVTVTVTDFGGELATWSLEYGASPATSAQVVMPELAARVDEGGRGLLLVSRFASRWGTSQDPGGRSVWFRLDGPS